MRYKDYKKGIAYRFRASAYGIVINEDDEVALILLNGGYYLPGGGIDDKESPHEALKREWLEETGYEIDVKQWICDESLYIFRNGMERCYYGKFYLATLTGARGKKIEDDHELVWVKISKALEILTLPHQKDGLEGAVLAYSKSQRV